MRKVSVFLILCLFISGVKSCTSDYTKNLGNGYFYRDEGDDIKDILSKNTNGKEIPSTVLDYNYNDKIIIAKQKPKLPQEPLYKKKYKYVNDGNNIHYWIIIKDKDICYGPLENSEYEKLRTKLEIPNNLQLK